MLEEMQADQAGVSTVQGFDLLEVFVLVFFWDKILELGPLKTFDFLIGAFARFAKMGLYWD